jgi:hypothetical protein
MKPLFIFLLITLSITSLQGQVGFNNPNPHPNSLLDLTATDKGLLIPRLTTVQRDALTLVLNPAAESLLVYDTNLKGFYFFQGGSWYSLSGWVKAIGSNNVSLSGNVNITGAISSGSITNSGVISTTDLRVSGPVEFLSGFRTQSSGPFLKTMVIPIGDWNMNATTNISVPLTGIDLLKVRSYSVLVRADTDFVLPQSVFQFPYNQSGLGIVGWFGAIFGNPLNMAVVVEAGSFFNSTGFDATSYNRGWITIVYEQ